MAWLVDHGSLTEAFELVGDSLEYGDRERRERMLEIGLRLVEKGLKEGEYEVAAGWCKVLEDGEKWEVWIARFAELGNARLLVGLMPVDPPLASKCYHLIISECLRLGEFAVLDTTIMLWPSTLYPIKEVIEEATALDTSGAGALWKVLYHLHGFEKNMDRQIYYGLLMRYPDLSLAIELNSAFSLFDDPLLLVQYAYDTTSMENPIDRIRASIKSKMLTLVVSHSTQLSPSKAYKLLSKDTKLLYIYLSALYIQDPECEYQQEMVLLTATHDSAVLLDFLRTANISPPAAFTICERFDLVPEMMFLLVKMGNNRKALSLLIDRVGDVQKVQT